MADDGAREGTADICRLRNEKRGKRFKKIKSKVDKVKQRQKHAEVSKQ